MPQRTGSALNLAVGQGPSGVVFPLSHRSPQWHSVLQACLSWTQCSLWGAPPGGQRGDGHSSSDQQGP